MTEPIPFENVEDLLKIKPQGGGGTSFYDIFEQIEKWPSEEWPLSIVILTDGYASFPEEEKAKGIPVLWIINNNEIQVPWGRVARIEI